MRDAEQQTNKQTNTHTHTHTTVRPLTMTTFLGPMGWAWEELAPAAALTTTRDTRCWRMLHAALLLLLTGAWGTLVRARACWEAHLATPLLHTSGCRLRLKAWGHCCCCRPLRRWAVAMAEVGNCSGGEVAGID